MYKTALTLYRPIAGKALATPGLTGCGKRLGREAPASLYHEFLDVCHSDNLDKIRAFHTGRVIPDTSHYSTFMGAVYGTLKEQKAKDQILHWFQMIATEIHRLY